MELLKYMDQAPGVIVTLGAVFWMLRRSDKRDAAKDAHNEAKDQLFAKTLQDIADKHAGAIGSIPCVGERPPPARIRRP